MPKPLSSSVDGLTPSDRPRDERDPAFATFQSEKIHHATHGLYIPADLRLRFENPLPHEPWSMHGQSSAGLAISVRRMSALVTRRGFNRALFGSAASAVAGCAVPFGSTRLAAVDCHAHVFHRELPMPDRRRAPAGYDATPEDHVRVLAANDMTQGVLVQPSFLGTDNSYLVTSLRKYPDRFRGIVVVDPSIGSEQLQILQDAGVVGIRLNLIGLPTPDFASTSWKALLAQVRERSWQIEVHQLARELRPVVDPLLGEGLNVVVDHFGRPDEKLGVEDPGFRYLLTLGPSRKVWVKLSGAYRNGPAGQGEATALAALPLLRNSFGLDRLVWGSDWPHTLFEKTVDYRSQRQLLDQWLPLTADRMIVLRETPARLFGFSS